jgi:hypothetical protein
LEGVLISAERQIPAGFKRFTAIPAMVFSAPMGSPERELETRGTD